jgi:hypothetical protein
LASVIVLGAAGSAAAAPFELYANISAGAMKGKGVGGAQSDADFFAGSESMTYGATLGVKLLFVQVWIDHHQFTNFNWDPLSTWTEFMAGVGFDFPLSDAPKGETPKLHAGIQLGIGFGVGTGQQVDPPLSNGQITDKGFLAEARVKLEYDVSSILRMGVAVPLTYGYLFKNGLPANDTDSQYQSLHIMVLGYLQLTFALGG